MNYKNDQSEMPICDNEGSSKRTLSKQASYSYPLLAPFSVLFHKCLQTPRIVPLPIALSGNHYTGILYTTNVAEKHNPSVTACHTFALLIFSWVAKNHAPSFTYSSQLGACFLQAATHSTKPRDKLFLQARGISKTISVVAHGTAVHREKSPKSH